MFREMRRNKQQLSRQETESILRSASSGVLAVCGDEEYPYAVPLSFAYKDGALYFHCAVKGHKLDAVRRSDKASFCVIERDTVAPEAYTTLYRSAIAFGRVQLVADDAERRLAMELLAEKYFPGQDEGNRQEISRAFPRLRVLKLTVEHMTGKQAAELMKP